MFKMLLYIENTCTPYVFRWKKLMSKWIINKTQIPVKPRSFEIFKLFYDFHWRLFHCHKLGYDVHFHFVLHFLVCTHFQTHFLYIDITFYYSIYTTKKLKNSKIITMLVAFDFLCLVSLLSIILFKKVVITFLQLNLFLV